MCLDEVAGTAGRKELLEMYNLATKESYSVLYINLVRQKMIGLIQIQF